MPTLDLTAEAAEIGMVLGAASEMSEHERRIAVSTWLGRMHNEHVSARVFGALVGQMMAAGSPAASQAAVAKMITEELEHGRLCAAVVAALGGEPVVQLDVLDDVPVHADVGPLEGLLRNVLSVSCLSETVAVALISAERDRVEPQELQEILQSILADEVQHARFGWTLLADHQSDLTPGLCTRLGDYLVTAFLHLRQHELSHLAPLPSPGPAAEAYGVCDGTDARALFFETVYEVIIPRLEEFGIPAAAAWEASYVLEHRLKPPAP